jgi:hypothetical protein
VNYLNENNHKQQINSLLKIYNLSPTANFATRLQNSSSTAIDNTFIDNERSSSSYPSPTVNGLSHHDAQFLTISNIATEVDLAPSKWRTRIINDETAAQFKRLLENEMWEPVFENRDTNYMFNSFLFMFLKVFDASFPIQKKIKNNWITQGIKIYLRHKRSLYTGGIGSILDHKMSMNPQSVCFAVLCCAVL